jgi:hypothetical protein
LIEAFAASWKPFAAALHDNDFGLRLEAIHKPLAGREPREFLPAKPLAGVTARHTVGIADPLCDDEIEVAARLDDGLPQSLADCIRRYGLKHFKLKLRGNAQADTGWPEPRLSSKRAWPAVSIDGWQRVVSLLRVFREFWDSLTATESSSEPVFVGSRSTATWHWMQTLDGLNQWTERPRLIIDRVGCRLDSDQTLLLGYRHEP